MPGSSLAPPPSCRIFTVLETLIFSPSRNHSPFTSSCDTSQVKTALSPSRTQASCRSFMMQTWRSAGKRQGARAAKDKGEQVAQGLGVRLFPGRGVAVPWTCSVAEAWQSPASQV